MKHINSCFYEFGPDGHTIIAICRGCYKKCPLTHKIWGIGVCSKCNTFNTVCTSKEGFITENTIKAHCYGILTGPAKGINDVSVIDAKYKRKKRKVT